MAEALIGITRSVEGHSFDSFRSNWLLQRGVERGIEIVSEAARHLPDDLLARHPEIPWKQIRGIGNVLRHEYHRSSNALIRGVVTEHLPALCHAVAEMQSHVSSAANGPA